MSLRNFTLNVSVKMRQVVASLPFSGAWQPHPSLLGGVSREKVFPYSSGFATSCLRIQRVELRSGRLDGGHSFGCALRPNCLSSNHSFSSCIALNLPAVCLGFLYVEWAVVEMVHMKLSAVAGTERGL